MARTKLISVFIIGMFVDGLILPSLFGFRESFLSVLVLVLTVLYLGCTKQNVFYGLAFSVILESLKGLTVGTLAIPFLLTAVFIYFIQRFVDIKYMPNQVINPGKLVVLALVLTLLVYVLLFFSGQGDIKTEYFDSAIIFVVTLEALMAVFIFNIIFKGKRYVP